MGLRFFRRVRIAPGVTINFTKTGASVSVGPRGAKTTFGKHGIRTTAGLPGTGLFYTEYHRFGGSKARSRRPRVEPAAAATPRNALNLGFFARLVTPKHEQAFVDGCKHLLGGDNARALAEFEQGLAQPDCQWLAALAAVRAEQTERAEELLAALARNPGGLGRLFSKYGVCPEAALEITPEFTLRIGPDLRGVVLLMAELLQDRGEVEGALEWARGLLQRDPSDLVAALSTAELLDGLGGRDAEILSATDRADHETVEGTACLLYRARALRRMGMLDAARDVLTTAVRRKAGRPQGLLHALWLERAEVYAAQGRKAQARRDIERIMAEDSSFEGVAELLAAL